MSLTLLSGRANLGKTGSVLEAFGGALDDGRAPWLIAPTRPDARRLLAEIVSGRGALIGARVGTLDDLTREILARAGAAPRRWVGPVEKRLLLEAVARDTGLDVLAASRETAGFADAMWTMVDSLGQALVPGEDLLGTLENDSQAEPVAREAARLYAAWRRYLQAEDALDPVAATARAAALASGPAGGRPGQSAQWTEPVFLCGFDDLSPADLALLEAIARSAEVLVSLTWVGGRRAFEGVARVAESLTGMASVVREMPAPEPGQRPATLAALEEHLFDEGEALLDPAALGVLSAAGLRAEVELVASEVRRAVDSGVPPQEVAIVARSLGAYRPLLRQILSSAGIPFDLEDDVSIGQVPLGRAVIALARFAAFGDREELFGLILSPYSGVANSEACAFAAAARRAGVADGRAAARLLWKRLRARGGLDAPGSTGAAEPGSEAAVLAWTKPGEGGDPYSLLRLLGDAAPLMLVHAWGRDDPPASDALRDDAAALAAVREAIAELRRSLAAGRELSMPRLLASLERVQVRTGQEERAGHVQVLPVLRARGRRFDTVVVIGLNERSFPVSPPEDPFFSDEARARLARAGIALPDPPGLAWDRYLFYLAVTRARTRLVFSYRSAGADGKPMARSFFLDDVAALVGEDALASVTRTKGLSSPAFAEPADAPGQDEWRRAQACRVAKAGAGLAPDLLARLVGESGPGWLAAAAARAAEPAPALSGAAAAALAARDIFSATQLESYATCPIRWFVDHELRPAPLDREVGALERGAVVHRVLEAIGPSLADRRFGEDEPYTEGVRAGARAALDEALERLAGRVDGLAVELARRLVARQLDAFLDMQAARRAEFWPARFEVVFGAAGCPPLVLDERTAVRGRIDRVDLAEDGRALLLDYKSGKGPTPKEILDDDHLQVRLYCLAWDALLAGHDGAGACVGGGYWGLGAAAVHGICDGDRTDAAEAGLPEAGVLAGAAWAQTLEAARLRAIELAARIRAADIVPPPPDQRSRCWGCEREAWCGLWS